MKDSVKNQMMKISKYAYWALLFVALMSFVFLVFFKADYYRHIWQPKMGNVWAYRAGYFLAIMIELARFASILASSNDKIAKNSAGFRIGLIISAGLVAYDWLVCEQMGLYWDSSTDLYTNIFRAVVVLGLVIEVRLCMMITDSDSSLSDVKSTDEIESDLLKSLAELEKLKGKS